MFACSPRAFSAASANKPVGIAGWPFFGRGRRRRGGQHQREQRRQKGQRADQAVGDGQSEGNRQRILSRAVGTRREADPRIYRGGQIFPAEVANDETEFRAMMHYYNLAAEHFSYEAVERQLCPLVEGFER